MQINQPNFVDYPFLYSNISLLHLILINYSAYISKLVEINVAFIPSTILRIKALRGFLLGTQGTISAVDLAIYSKHIIHVGGGFHHAHFKGGSGFCCYNDIGLACEYLFKFYSEKIKKILIIDLDAHQGNGHQRDKIRFGNKVVIADVYNPNIFPYDIYAKQFIDFDIHVTSRTSSSEYIDILKDLLKQLDRFSNYDFIIYNAGTDILIGDNLGRLNVSPEDIVKRDELVFEFALNKKIPIVMLLSGGYQQSNAKIIAQSISNLQKKFSILN